MNFVAVISSYSFSTDASMVFLCEILHKLHMWHTVHSKTTMGHLLKIFLVHVHWKFSDCISSGNIFLLIVPFHISSGTAKQMKIHALVYPQPSYHTEYLFWMSRTKCMNEE